MIRLFLTEQLLKDLPEHRLSYGDAVSLAIMKNDQIHKVFGFDQRIYILNFEMVPN